MPFTQCYSLNAIEPQDRSKIVQKLELAISVASVVHFPNLTATKTVPKGDSKTKLSESNSFKVYTYKNKKFIHLAVLVGFLLESF